MFFAVSSASILFLWGMGYAVIHLFRLQDDSSPFVEKFPLILATGLLVNHLILLLSQSLKLSLVWGVMIFACGLVWCFVRRKKEIMPESGREWLPVAAMAVILVLYYFAILCDPLEGWDARSIWFFHSKMIWSAGSLNMSAGWDDPSLQWSHVDYPKLIPALAAQILSVLGYWNEYAPKFALFLLFLPALFWIFSFYNRRFSFLFLVLVFPFGLNSHLWNGFMDGYIALYAAVAVLLMGRYIQKRRLMDLVSALTCLVLLGNIKNEGMVIGLIGMASWLVTELLSARCKTVALKEFFSPHRIVWLAVVMSPCLLWSVFYKYQWHLANDLQIGTRQSWLRIAGRFSDGESFPLILRTTIFHDESAVGLSVIALMAGLVLLTVFRRRTLCWIPASMMAFLYYCSIVLVYLLTPNDLNWHLATSAQRTMLTVSSCLLAGAYFVFSELESAASGPERKNRERAPG